MSFEEEWKEFISITRPFSRAEDEEILQFLELRGLFSHVNGNTVWRRMEKAKICDGKRNWKSLKSRYFENIQSNAEITFHSSQPTDPLLTKNEECTSSVKTTPYPPKSLRVSEGVAEETVKSSSSFTPERSFANKSNSERTPDTVNLSDSNENLFHSFEESIHSVLHSTPFTEFEALRENESQHYDQDKNISLPSMNTTPTSISQHLTKKSSSDVNLQLSSLNFSTISSKEVGAILNSSEGRLSSCLASYNVTNPAEMSELAFADAESNELTVSSTPRESEINFGSYFNGVRHSTRFSKICGPFNVVNEPGTCPLCGRTFKGAKGLKLHRVKATTLCAFDVYELAY